MALIDSLLGRDDEAYEKLQAAIAAGKTPCDLLNEAYATNGTLQTLITHYPKTLQLLQQNQRWLTEDMDRIIEYLVILAGAQ